jgi:hypothetical protein
MAFGLKPNKNRIRFEDIQEGDRLRVRYTEGDRWEDQDMWGHPNTPRGASIGVLRTIVSEAKMRPMESVWLSQDGKTVVHKDWAELEIIRLDKMREGG